MITKKYAEGFCWLCVVSVASLLESLAYVSPHLSQLNGFSLACSFSWISKRFWSANFFSQFEQMNVSFACSFSWTSKRFWSANFFSQFEQLNVFFVCLFSWIFKRFRSAKFLLHCEHLNSTVCVVWGTTSDYYVSHGGSPPLFPLDSENLVHIRVKLSDWNILFDKISYGSLCLRLGLSFCDFYWSIVPQLNTWKLEASFSNFCFEECFEPDLIWWPCFPDILNSFTEVLQTIIFNI